jgi:myo-inositol-1(or 4)-monophosphatase
VSETDIAAGVLAVRHILSRDTDARFVVEEDEVYEIAGIDKGDLGAGACWVIDPIDGTTSFLHGFPCYSVSIARLEDGVPVVGAVYNVALDEMHSASRGQGAFTNGEPIRVSTASRVNEALMVTGFPYDRTTPLDRQLAVLAAFLRNPVHGIRRDGSAAIDCCHVAGGRCDGFWEYSLKVWDVAAGVLLCTEAGAHVTDIDGRPWTIESDSICAANPTLHEEMLRVIAQASEALSPALIEQPR